MKFEEQYNSQDLSKDIPLALSDLAPLEIQSPICKTTAVQEQDCAANQVKDNLSYLSKSFFSSPHLKQRQI